jgi:hypothetical protein
MKMRFVLTYLARSTLALWVRGVWCFVVVCLMLVACRAEEPAAESAPPPATVVSAAPTQPPATEPETTSAPADLTAAPPTDAPAETIAATSSPEATYTAEPVDQGGGGIGPQGNTPAGNCANPYYPVLAGATYRYRSTDSLSGTTDYRITYHNITSDSFEVSFDFGEPDDPEAVTITQTWQCTAEGLLAPGVLQLSNMEMPFTFEVVEAVGLTLPSSFETGETWTTHYVVVGSGDVESTSMSMEQTIDLTNEIVGTEAVSVPAGDYPAAVRVESSGTISIATTLGETAAPATMFDWSQTTWYVEGVGMVRQESAGILDETTPTVVELVAIE